MNLAASLGIIGKKVILVDADSQGNATSGLGVDKKGINCSLCDVFFYPEKINNALIDVEFENLKLLPPGNKLCKVEQEFEGNSNREFLLKSALEELDAGLLPHYVLIDCPPAMNLITLNALISSNYVLIPIQCEYYALEGLSQLLSSVRQVRQRKNSSLGLLGVLFTMYSKRLKLTVQVENEVKKYLGEKVFNTTVPRSVRLSEAPSFGKPIAYFDKSSPGAKAYLDLAEEVIHRCQ